MDVRETPEQAELRRTALQLARELGPRSVVDLDDEKRGARLAKAVADAGWLELRDDDGEGHPLAGGVEAALIAEALAGCVADVAFAGPVLASDLARRAGADAGDAVAVAFAADLIAPARSAGGPDAPIHAVDAGRAGDSALLLVADGERARLARIALAAPETGTDLGRRLRRPSDGARPVQVPGARPLDADALRAWTALGLALTSADLVGVMRGLLDVCTAYASERRQYGVPIGSFQAVQHLLAEARCLLEGSHSAALYAAWAVDALPPAEAEAAGRVAKAYAARAARSVCETAVQVHGGMGNTWECIVHVYLRRALLSTQWFGDDGAQLLAIQRERLAARGDPGGAHGLP